MLLTVRKLELIVPTERSVRSIVSHTFNNDSSAALEILYITSAGNDYQIPW